MKDLARGGVGALTISDAQVIALARESQGEAIEVLYNAYKSRIYTFILRILGEPEVADDITQDVFTKAYQALNTLTKDHRVLPWLYRIANNAAIDHVRRRKRIKWLPVGDLLGHREEPLVGDSQSSITERDQVRAILAKMPIESVTALLLHSLEGYTYREIAEIQGSTLPAVRSRIARARQAFRDAYETKESS